MSDWAPRTLREAALQKVEARLAAAPDDIDARFNHCSLLAELGQVDEAKVGYIELLKRAPDHFGTLINLGNLVHAQGYRSAAITLYTRAAHLYPDNPRGHVNVANLLVETHQTALAMEHYEKALRIDADQMEANRGMAYLLTQARDEERAAIYRQRAFQSRPLLEFAYTGKGQPARLLLLVSASGGAIPMRHHCDQRVFLVTALFAEFYDPANPLPPHELIVNTISDADLCRPALRAALVITSRSTAPVINHPSNVLLTGRLENAQRLAAIPNVIAPKMSLLPKALLQSTDGANVVLGRGFTFPLLLRAPGFHTGHFFSRVEDVGELGAHVSPMPGEEVLVIRYLDARKPDGKIRKFRVMMIDGILYPLHVAISHDWKIHFFTAEMADHPEHRAEDAAFLNDMAGVLGARAIEALNNISRALGLEYAGIDFSLSDEGEILLFEANATMVVNPPERDARWDYRRPAVQRILDAIRRMLTPTDLNASR